MISPGRTWSLNSSWPDCSGLSCRGGSSSGRPTLVPPSLFGLSPPLAFSKRRGGGGGGGGKAHSFFAPVLKNALAGPPHTILTPTAKDSAAKGSPIPSGEVKSAPNGNFNCLTRPDFPRGGSAGRGGKREAAATGNRGQAAAEKGD